MPADVNHWLLLTFVDVAVLGAVGIAVARRGRQRARSCVLSTSASLRWCALMVLLVYGFAAFAKVNSSFLDAEISCGPYMVRSLLQTGPLDLSFGRARPALASGERSRSRQHCRSCSWCGAPACSAWLSAARSISPCSSGGTCRSRGLPWRSTPCSFRMTCQSGSTGSSSRDRRLAAPATLFGQLRMPACVPAARRGLAGVVRAHHVRPERRRRGRRRTGRRQARLRRVLHGARSVRLHFASCRAVRSAGDPGSCGVASPVWLIGPLLVVANAAYSVPRPQDAEHVHDVLEPADRSGRAGTTPSSPESVTDLRLPGRRRPRSSSSNDDELAQAARLDRGWLLYALRQRIDDHPDMSRHVRPRRRAGRGVAGRGRPRPLRRAEPDPRQDLPLPRRPAGGSQRLPATARRRRPAGILTATPPGCAPRLPRWRCASSRSGSGVRGDSGSTRRAGSHAP